MALPSLVAILIMALYGAVCIKIALRRCHAHAVFSTSERYELHVLAQVNFKSSEH